MQGTEPAVVVAGAAAILAITLAAGTALLWRRERRRADRMDDELARARRRSEAATAARQAFFDLATHELRSPLSAILGYQELLQDGAYGALEPSAGEPVDRIGRSARHLLHLIDGLVELSRLAAGDVQPDLAPVNLRILLGSTAEGFRNRAAERGLEPRVRVGDGLATITSDQDRLTRALDLLVTSAIKHPAGDTLDLDIEPIDRGARVTIRGANVSLRQDTDDPTLRLGIRLAVVLRTAELLGGELRLDPPDGPVAERLSLTVRDVEPGAGGRL